ncbi:hypothetical protein [Sulfitobacter guttiformis]|uniref:FlgN protein n=1 Tax=Sulfitobacter guttiformis TaxID=74349 RepID=A0A420DSI1_9RHOB|nr:hypothetical protein [Sulfitobacter guttiformis]KIN74543.1 FlgN-like protein [Sulfitobacter guttiformis KCTC 32187]RKE97130.1 hypothetical protein C8N30_1716 [Sulfitobacter guttiformis]
MTSNVTDFSKLDSLLEQERVFLLKGDIAGLATLLGAKEQLVELLLSNATAHHDQIRPLEGKLRRNQLLLDGALDGIRAVAARLAALRQVRTALDTYDAQGRKQRVAISTSPKVEKRA